MKSRKLILSVMISLCVLAAHSQHVRVQMSFPVGVSVRPPGPPPFGGAIWIGPEWRWQTGAYVCVPGYWERPGRRHGHYKPGHWKYTRRGYVWVPGRWR